MREILFKGKEINSDKWVEGYLVKISEDDYRIATEEDINWSYTKLGDYDGVMTCVNPETICQYTGLTDKNGNKIWENDVLCGHGNKDDLAKVSFGEFDVIDVETIDTVDRVEGWHTKPIQTDMLSRCLPFCLSMPLTDFYINRGEYEVIGTIFDNPELLENE